MCVATTAGNISFTESCKTTSTLPNVIRETRSDMIRVRTGNAVNGLGEEITIQMDANGDQSYDSYLDLPYLPSPYDNATHLWSSNNNGDQFLLNNIGTTTDHLMIPMTLTQCELTIVHGSKILQPVRASISTSRMCILLTSRNWVLHAISFFTSRERTIACSTSVQRHRRWKHRPTCL